jgi:hypothetical protein
MKIHFPDTVKISSWTFKVIQNPEVDGASFDFATNELKIGTKSLKQDPDYVFMIICHELLEMSYAALNYRYRDFSVNENWKFFMDHKEFENATAIFSTALKTFIK